MQEQPARMYIVFVDAGVQHFESATLTPTTNEQLLAQLRNQCRAVEFIARDVSRREMTLDAVARELETQHDKFDGVVVFGGLDHYRYIAGRRHGHGAGSEDGNALLSHKHAVIWREKSQGAFIPTCLCIQREERSTSREDL